MRKSKYERLLSGGPWDGQTVRLKPGAWGFSLPLRVGEFAGRYHWSAQKQEGTWVPS